MNIPKPGYGDAVFVLLIVACLVGPAAVAMTYEDRLTKLKNAQVETATQEALADFRQQLDRVKGILDDATLRIQQAKTQQDDLVVAIRRELQGVIDRNESRVTPVFGRK